MSSFASPGGLVLRPHFELSGAHFSKQAFAAWQWYNYVADRVPAGKTALRINLDETSVCLFQGTGRGTVFVSKKRRLTQHAPRALRRRCMTHVGVVCDDTTLQPHLPQVLIGNWSTFKAGSMAALRARAPPNVVLLRQRSAWSNEAVCAWIVTLIGHALAPYMHAYQPILVMDASTIHTARKVLAACYTACIWVSLVPARLTGVLQPLDTHGFQRYKAHLRRKYLEERIDAVGDILEVGEFLSCVYSAIRSVLQGIRWSRAFDDDGFSAGQGFVAPHILERLEVGGPMTVPHTRPADAVLAHCFPRRATIPTTLLWRPFDPAPAPRAVPLAARDARVAAAPTASAVLREPRTRAEHRAAAAARAAAAVPAAAPSSGAASSSSVGAAPAAASASRVWGRTRSETRMLRARGDA